jgi:hypothetical protein
VPGAVTGRQDRRSTVTRAARKRLCGGECECHRTGEFPLAGCGPPCCPATWLWAQRCKNCRARSPCASTPDHWWLASPLAWPLLARRRPVRWPGALVMLAGHAAPRWPGLSWRLPMSSRRRRVTSAASCVRAEMSNLAKMCARCVWTVRREIYRRAPICGLDSPSATRFATECSVGVRPSQPNYGRPHLRAARPRFPCLLTADVSEARHTVFARDPGAVCGEADGVIPASEHQQVKQLLLAEQPG